MHRCDNSVASVGHQHGRGRRRLETILQKRYVCILVYAGIYMCILMYILVYTCVTMCISCLLTLSVYLYGIVVCLQYASIVISLLYTLTRHIYA